VFIIYKMFFFYFCARLFLKTDPLSNLQKLHLSLIGVCVCVFQSSPTANLVY